MFSSRPAERLQSWLNIKSNEVAPAALLTLYYFLVTGATILLNSSASAIFFDVVPEARTLFSLTLIGVAVCAFFIVEVLQRLTAPGTLVPLTLIASVSMAGVIALLAWTYPQSPLLVILLYVAVEVARIISFVQYWLIVGEIFNTRQAKRIFGLIGAGGAVAGILAGVGLNILRNLLSLQVILLAGCVLLFLAGLMAPGSGAYLPDSIDHNADTDNDTDSDAPFDSYVLIIMLVIGLTIVTATVVEYAFRTTGGDVFSGADFAAFIGTFSAIVGVLQLIVRLGVVGRLLSRFGILTGLLLLPLGIMGGSALTLLLGVPFAMLVVVKLIDQVLRYTIYESATELLWVPIPLQRRGRAKSFIGGTVTSAIQGVTGLLLFAGATMLPDARLLEVLLSVVILGAIVWVLGLIAVRRRYVHELMQSIRERRLDFTELRIDVADNEMVRRIDAHLKSEHPAEQAFALDVINELDLAPWASTLHQIFHDSDMLIRERVLQLAGEDPSIIPDTELLRLLESPGRLTYEATIAAGKRGMIRIIPLLQSRLTHPNMQVRAASAEAILLINSDGDSEITDEAGAVLKQMLWSSRKKVVEAATHALLRLPVTTVATIVDGAVVRRLLAHDAVTIRKAGIQIAGHLHQVLPFLLEDVVAALADVETALLARRMLRRYPSAAVEETFLACYPQASSDLKVGIVRVLDEYPVPRLHEMLLNHLEPEDRLLYRESIEELLEISRAGRLESEVDAVIERQVTALSRLLYGRYVLLSLLDASHEGTLLQVAIEHDIRHSKAALIKLSLLDAPDISAEDVIHQLQTGDVTTISNAVELLDNVCSPQERALIIPLVEVKQVEELAAIGRTHFDDLPETISDALWHDLNGEDAWHAAVALDTLLQHPDERKRLSEEDVPDWTITRELWKHYQRVLQGDCTMLSQLEKTLLLRNSTLFEGVDVRQLYHVAQITDEVTFEPGELIFSEGDKGEIMYVVTEGEIKVHRGSQVLAMYRMGECLGEIALLDLQPRTASATAVGQVKALSVVHDDFFELMSMYPDIMKRVIQLLTAKFRTASRQLAEL
jgi:hypothetical protein